MATPKPDLLPPPKKGRPKKSAIELGAKQSARIASRRIVSDTIKQTSLHPALKLALISGIGALASYFISKRV